MNRIRNWLTAAGIPVTDGQLSQLETYYEMVIEKNKVMNLTAITKRDEFIEKHLIDSLAPLAVPKLRSLLMGGAASESTANGNVSGGSTAGVSTAGVNTSGVSTAGVSTAGVGSAGVNASGVSKSEKDTSDVSTAGVNASSENAHDKYTPRPVRLIDVGTGAGFPGIPLKILCPSLSVTLLDSLQKRVGFLQEVIDTLKLRDVTAVHMRAEEGGQDPQYREKYDLAVSRAVANLSMLAEYDLPFVKVGGTFLAYKSGDVEDELKSAGHAIRTVGGHYEEPILLTLPGSDIRRALILIRKERHTPKAYPRKAGTAKKNPL